MRVTRHDSCWVPPFGHPRITARLPTPQGLSQAPTSFIGSRCQGIHHAPFIACLTHQQNNHYKVLASTIQISNNNPTPTPNPPPRESQNQPGTKPPTPTPQPNQDAERRRRRKRGGLMPQNPNSVPPPTPDHPSPCAQRQTTHTGREADDSTSEHHQPPTHTRGRTGARAP